MILLRILKVIGVFALSLFSFGGLAHAQNGTVPTRHYVSAELPILLDLQTSCLAGSDFLVNSNLEEVRGWTRLLDIKYREELCKNTLGKKKLKDVAAKLGLGGMLIVKRVPPGLPPYGEIGDNWERLSADALFPDLPLLADGVRIEPLVIAKTFLIVEAGMGGNVALNDPTLGATQKTGRKTGGLSNFSIYFPVLETDSWVVMPGVQVFGGGTDNDSLKNPAPAAPSPFGGRTEYVGAALLLALEAKVHAKLVIDGYVGVGAAKIDFNGIQGGVEVVSGKDTVPVFKAGVAAFVPLGTDGWEIGGGLDFTEFGEFDMTTSTSTTLRQGRTRDLFVGAKIRLRLGDDPMVPDSSIFEDGFESGYTTSWSNGSGQ